MKIKSAIKEYLRHRRILKTIRVLDARNKTSVMYHS